MLGCMNLGASTYWETDLHVRMASRPERLRPMHPSLPRFLRIVPSLLAMRRGAAVLALWLGAVTVSLGPAAKAAEPESSTISSEAYTHPQQLVAIDGQRRLNLFCQGTGEPTVLFDAGAGQSMVVWRHVQGQVAALTRACAYDRAGYGFSDPSPRASDARNAVEDLHRLLQAARIRTPIVYVGHSIAGLYGVLFVAAHPKEVSGVVLVDPSFAQQWPSMAASFLPAERRQVADIFARIQGQRRACLELARSGALEKPATLPAQECTDTRGYPDALDDVLRQELARQYARPHYFSTSISEYDSFWPRADMTSIDARQLDAASGGFGDRPLVVLTHGKDQPLLPGITPEQQARSGEAWKTGHALLARKSTRGTNTVVANAGHFIQIDQPAAVADAVRRVLEDVRRSPPAKVSPGVTPHPR